MVHTLDGRASDITNIDCTTQHNDGQLSSVWSVDAATHTCWQRHAFGVVGEHDVAGVVVQQILVLTDRVRVVAARVAFVRSGLDDVGRRYHVYTTTTVRHTRTTK
jgi:hypothetical protein